MKVSDVLTLKGQGQKVKASSSRSNLKKILRMVRKVIRKSSEDINMQLLRMTLTKLLKVTPKKGENGL